MITSRSSPELRSIPEGVPHIHDKEIMVFMNGLPKTKRIKLLHESMFVNGEKIFGKKPSLINIYEDSNHVSTGKGYFEFEDHNIKDIIQKSNGYKLDKKQWTLDRIDNNIPHTKENVVLCCLKCNLERKNMKQENFIYNKNLKIIKK